MYNHAPKDYKCPRCIGISGIESEDTLLKKSDLVYITNSVSVYINSFWIPTCEGHVIVVPNEHFENLYELPDNVADKIIETSKQVALAMKKAYKCDGITIRQNNEPASAQHAFHYHMHIFPRYDNDTFDNGPLKSFLSDPKERVKYKNKLLKYISSEI